MSDDLAKLESALRATSPKAPATVRERAISEAMAAFDRHHQGSSGELRHRKRVPKSGTSWIRKLAMPLSRPTLALAGSAAVVVVAVLVSHQLAVTPPSPPADDAESASVERSGNFRKGLSLPLPEATENVPPLAPAAGEAPGSSPAPAVARAAVASEQDRSAARPAQAGAPGVVLSTGVLRIDEGGSGTYTARLASRPKDTVTVTPSSDDADVIVSPASLRFDAADWDVPQTVTVRAAEDDDAIDDTAAVAHAVMVYGAVTHGGTIKVTVLDAGESTADESMKRSGVTRIIDFPFPQSDFRIAVKLPAGDEVFRFPAIPHPMKFLSDADIPRETAGVANLDSAPARFFKRPVGALRRIDPDGWRTATPGTAVAGR